MGGAMRLALLGLIFLLVLTLGNALLLRRDQHRATASDYAPLQLRLHRETHYEWDAFIWREIGAIVVTAVIFGGISTVARPERRLRGGPPATKG